MYKWTKKAEDRAKEIGVEARPEGIEAWCGNHPVSGQIAQAWLELGYIKGEGK
jgi:hypothetical protein